MVVPFIKLPLPDGSLLLKPGKPQPVPVLVGAAEASRLVRMSRRWVAAECQTGRFRSARKLGARPNSQWRIAAEEVMARHLRADWPAGEPNSASAATDHEIPPDRPGGRRGGLCARARGAF